MFWFGLLLCALFGAELGGILAKIDSAPLGTLASKPLPRQATGKAATRRPARPGLYALFLGLAVAVPLLWTQLTF